MPGDGTFISEDNQKEKVYRMPLSDMIVIIIVAIFAIPVLGFLIFMIIIPIFDYLLKPLEVGATTVEWISFIITFITTFILIILPIISYLSRKIIITPKLFVFKTLFRKKLIPLDRIRIIGWQRYEGGLAFGIRAAFVFADNPFDEKNPGRQESFLGRIMWLMWENDQDQLKIKTFNITNFKENNKLIANLFKYASNTNKDKELLKKVRYSPYFFFKMYPLYAFASVLLIIVSIFFFIMGIMEGIGRLISGSVILFLVGLSPAIFFIKNRK